MRPTTFSSVADTSLIQAVERTDIAGVRQALTEGANPNARKPYRGLSGEPAALMAVRRNDADILGLLAEAGAELTAAMAMAAALAAERATRKAQPETLSQVEAIVNLLEKHGVDWGIPDRLIGHGLRAIDVLAACQPVWALAAGRRQNLEPVPLPPQPLVSDSSSGRQRRQARN